MEKPAALSCSAPRACTLRAVLASTAKSVTVWVRTARPMISTRSRLRKLPMGSARIRRIVGARGRRREQPVEGMRLSARSIRSSLGAGRAVITAIALWSVFLCAAPATAASLAITVQLPDGRPFADAVVTVQAVGKKLPAPAPIQAVMDQMHRMFVPEVIVIPVGSTVSFPNSDSVSHQIYSFSPAKRFQLQLYRGKPYAPELFDQSGVVIL